jgi:hypothetical protein
MKIHWTFCAGMTLLALTTSCATAPPDTAPDEASIRELDALWSKTAGTNDLEGAVAFYTDDAYLLPPNAPLAFGK